ncbi:metallophosphoesterase family protein [Capnocytophaga sp.]|uniref:metallophosphoesterase family protein n=1 Tax=Capnocytophaga sp. TaxID=44737 RepID=UPI0026DD8CC6|nr:metallophosphoesterase family protein [Capnocytophaga sp.]MDO5105338.1 metallophosphoesterase family protein [Capnocytophaga sp.]
MTELTISKRRTLVIGDIHGAYKALIQVLERANIQKNDYIIFLGDYVDGWSQTPQVLDFLIQFKMHYNCLFLRGNHDALCLDFLKGKPMQQMWYFHGGDATEKAYQNISGEIKQRHVKFLESLTNYYLDGKNRLFVHAGFTNLRGVDFEYFPEMFYWDRTLWELATSVEVKPNHRNFPGRLLLYSETFIGHTPTTRLGSDKPLNANNVWNIDTGAAFKGRITVMDVDTKEYWQSDPVFQLYPDEIGRNK